MRAKTCKKRAKTFYENDIPKYHRAKNHSRMTLSKLIIRLSKQLRLTMLTYQLTLLTDVENIVTYFKKIKSDGTL